MWWTFERYIWITLRIILYSISIRKDVHASFKDVQNAVEENFFMKYMVKQSYILMPTNYHNREEFIYFRKRGCEFISMCCLNPAIIYIDAKASLLRFYPYRSWFECKMFILINLEKILKLRWHVPAFYA